jgi:hypothetical protein
MKLSASHLSRRLAAQLLEKVHRIGIVAVVAGALFLTIVGAPHDGVSASTTSPNHVVVSRVNTIRSSFGLSTGQMISTYNAQVLRGLQSNEDPPFAPVAGGIVEEGSIWGLLPGSSTTDDSSLRALVNAWVYDDGWSGSVGATSNADCTSAKAPGCNGHRRDVLSTPPVPGAKLYIDVEVRNTNYEGSPAVAVAALMIWKTPPID